ncbi:MAG: FMN-binding negative transcriptional regulator [Planctomycetota bacterium]|nr:FMN-binding negative transcriptional regulator [Planctomycetota bacterium]
MYVPAYADITPERTHGIAREHPFALLCSEVEGAPFATHLPLLLEEEAGTWWLRGHVAKPNPHWRGWDGARPAMAVFRGPHAYISPRWYLNPGEVPTWNYLAAHASGRPCAVQDAEWLRALLRRMADRFDPVWGAQTPSPETARKHAALLGGIVGFEMRVEQWTGKAKLGQNKSAENREAAARGLEATARPAEAAVAVAMRAS